MDGQVYKIFSDFYYVRTKYGIVECKLREILKKKSESVIVGDWVEIDALTENKSQAFISKVHKRNNFLSRPKVANISNAIIVSALKNPDLDFEQLNRYIALCEYHKIKPVLCFNKSDLIDDTTIFDKIKKIYEPIGYEIFFTSTLLKTEKKDFFKLLKGDVSILCGSSGAGKSSIINILTDGIYNLSTKSVSEKTKRGVHTTRHCEIYKISESASIVDTPGFSNVKFNFLLPKDIQFLFPEIKNLSNCKFKDCLHLREIECNVLNNIDKIAPSRYESYQKFVNEAKEFKEKITYEGKKCESSSKINKGIEVAKISENARALSRKTTKQNMVKNGIDND